MSGDVTHAKCPRCNIYQPVLWRGIEVQQPTSDGSVNGFKGMECICRSCDFSIAELGSIYHR